MKNSRFLDILENWEVLAILVCVSIGQAVIIPPDSA